MKKKSIISLILLMLSLLLTGCWSSHEVNTLGLTVAIGIDKSENGYLISEQVINPKAIASNRVNVDSPVTVFSAEGVNIQETVTRLTTLTSRKIYSSHLRMVILSEDIAKEGIGDIIDYLLRYHEYRTDFYFAIAKGFTAKEILTILTPTETIPGIAMFNRLKTSYEEWAPTKAVQIVELANELMAEGINPVINGIEIVGDDVKTDSTDVLKKTGDYEKLQFTELGAFDRDKLVGWLNENEAKGYNFVCGTVKHTSGYAEENGVELSYDVLKASSKIKAAVEDNQPKIDVYIEAETKVVGVKGDLDVSKIENLETIEKMAEVRLKDICEASVKKAQQELKTDIFGFGERVHDKDPAYWKSVKDNWNEVFSAMPVTIHVTLKVIATGDLKQPIMKQN